MEILVKIESGHKPKSTNILPKTLVKVMPSTLEVVGTSTYLVLEF